MKYGLIGCGRISFNHIQAAINNNLEIVGLCDLYEERIKEKKEVDYLQVFKLSREQNEQGIICQKIVHKQEQPPMEDVCYLVTDEAVNETVFCIDDETHHTFLLSREY